MKYKRQGDLSNAEVTASYGSNIQRGLNSGALPGVPPCNIHKLRSVYNAMVNVLWTSPVSGPRTAMRILGHCTLHDSLHYSSIRLDGLDGLRGSRGNLLFD